MELTKEQLMKKEKEADDILLKEQLHVTATRDLEEQVKKLHSNFAGNEYWFTLCTWFAGLAVCWVTYTMYLQIEKERGRDKKKEME